MGKWLTRLAVVGLIAIAAGWVSLQLFQRPIGAALFERAAKAQAGADRMAELPDGLHLFFCGTGSPMPDIERGEACLGVVAGERYFIIDTGAGGARKLTRMGFPMDRVERVYLTHLHSDHIGGMGETMLLAWVGGDGRSEPLPVAGPPGVERVVAGFNEAFAIDSTYRTAHHGRAVADPAGYGARAEAIDLRGASTQVVLDEGGLTITAIAVDHSPVEPAYGFRIDYAGRSAAVSGDLVFDLRFVEASRDVDVMVHEALQPALLKLVGEAMAARGATNTAKILHDIQDYHASPEDAARAAQAAGAGELIITHIVPPLPSDLLEAAFLADAPKAFDGRITLAEDGMIVSLPAGSDAVRFSRGW